MAASGCLVGREWVMNTVARGVAWFITILIGGNRRGRPWVLGMGTAALSVTM
jgi:hypothetical protein